ncbi:membrane protein [Jongsikchunia kroppenstedtii]|uniref:membrane protein n=1 Tax=Jongsikchunia kroppenstedtii TaxID=1121721 RepID=UPI00047567D1|nr:membrane protein [Jongsikchunia kroppenstedtii]
MLAFLGVLLLIWIAFVVIGFAIKGLVWLAIIGLILFIATSIVGWIRRGADK